MVGMQSANVLKKGFIKPGKVEARAPTRPATLKKSNLTATLAAVRGTRFAVACKALIERCKT